MDVLSPRIPRVQTGVNASLSGFNRSNPAQTNVKRKTMRVETDPQVFSGHRTSTSGVQKPEDAQRPAGPPPSFDISVLEQELDFKRIIARHQAAQSLHRDSQAVRPAEKPAEKQVRPAAQGWPQNNVPEPSDNGFRTPDPALKPPTE